MQSWRESLPPPPCAQLLTSQRPLYSCTTPAAISPTWIWISISCRSPSNSSHVKIQSLVLGSSFPLPPPCIFYHLTSPLESLPKKPLKKFLPLLHCNCFIQNIIFLLTILTLTPQYPSCFIYILISFSIGQYVVVCILFVISSSCLLHCYLSHL